MKTKLSGPVIHAGKNFLIFFDKDNTQLILLVKLALKKVRLV